MKPLFHLLAGSFTGLMLAFPFMQSAPASLLPLFALGTLGFLLIAAGLPRLNQEGGLLSTAAVVMQKKEIQLLRSRVKSLRSVLSYYGERSFYTTGGARRDMGSTARRALQYDEDGRTSATALKVPAGEA
jgi:hypothetical protein